MISAFIEKHHLPNEFKRTVKQFYQPLADKIFNQYLMKNSAFFVGINGCQGSGKSTLTDFLATYLLSIIST
jgi:D-glycerate 3-kinase